MKASPQTTLVFSPPLGYHDGVRYSPHVVYLDLDENGVFTDLMETTAYRVQNPDLGQRGSCFDLAMSELTHAGEDWYRIDGNSTAGAEITAVADGVVYKYESEGNYPGKALILEHTLTGEQKIYSVYMHLADNVLVTDGDPVTRGQPLGIVLTQTTYIGAFPAYHPADDSHLHFEMRYFASAYGIYNNNPRCDLGDDAGRGYVLPTDDPNTFPTAANGYTAPTALLMRHAGPYHIYLPGMAWANLSQNYEPNDTRTTAYTISTNISYTAFIGTPTDIDFYKISVSASSTTPKEIEIHLHNPLQGNYDLQLYRPSGELFYSSVNHDCNCDEYIRTTVSQGGYYRIGVTSYLGYSPFQPYIFSVTIHTVTPLHTP